jgi:hypothetical protein
MKHKLHYLALDKLSNVSYESMKYTGTTFSSQDFWSKASSGIAFPTVNRSRRQQC